MTSLTLRPTANGTHQDFSVYPSGTPYVLVSDEDDDTGVEATVVDAKETFTVEQTEQTGTITSVKVGMRAKPSVAPPTLIFDEIFASGTFDNWTGLYNNPVISTDHPVKGAYSAKLGFATAYKTFGSYYNELYFHFKWRTTSLPDTDTEQLRIATIERAASYAVARLFIYHNGTDVVWKLVYRDGGQDITVYSALQKNPSANIDYDIEIYAKTGSASASGYKVWINGVELTDISQSGKNQGYNANQIRLDTTTQISPAATAYYDCIEVAESYIGVKNKAKTLIITEEEEELGDETEINGSDYTDYETEYLVNPVTEEAWTWEEINALEIGIKSYKFSTGSILFSELWVEVIYSEGGSSETVTVEEISEFKDIAELSSTKYKIENDITSFTDSVNSLLNKKLSNIELTGILDTVLIKSEINSFINDISGFKDSVKVTVSKKEVVTNVGRRIRGRMAKPQYEFSIKFPIVGAKNIPIKSILNISGSKSILLNRSIKVDGLFSINILKVIDISGGLYTFLNKNVDVNGKLSDIYSYKIDLKGNKSYKLLLDIILNEDD